MRVSALILMCFTLSACTYQSLTKEQCLSGDWRGIGYQDGLLGQYPDRIVEHAEACAETGVRPNISAWQQGRAEGLVYYCTEDNFYRLGINGQAMHYVCDKAKMPQLQKVYRQAYEEYDLQQKIYSAQQQIQDDEVVLEKLKNGEMLTYKTEKEARAELLRLQNHIWTLKQHIEQYQNSLQQAKLKE
ncbi:DUF2799 domain-containing protein [Actinobacillus delphinicola]|uniref:Lipoprotein n=1 Tax=Actinobacillus delphinicola TaxID=51161 RepID=A0A448TSF8_9PAST|nr:DUF2799 domain-containing protein [Actinobacillus delphinicola]VEJ08835.1 lipoprotein [Actinobacillus delphinicola]